MLTTYTNLLQFCFLGTTPALALYVWANENPCHPLPGIELRSLSLHGRRSTSRPRTPTINYELEKIRSEKLKGFFVRSCPKWIDNGEKVTRYFCNLEKQHNSTKSISFIEKQNGETIRYQEEILNETKLFYENLYKEQDKRDDFSISDFLLNCTVNKLDYVESKSIEGLLNYQEVTLTLKQMSNDKSPGPDGFSANFFKVFWLKIGHFVVRSLDYALLDDSFSSSIKLGIIICIPKDNKPKKLLKNWRPITLLNVLYKIASGTIANRLKTVLDKLISSDQTGFLKNRFIGENTRLINDIMKYYEDNNTPGLLMLLDFEKAFDSLSFDFILKTFDFFGFGLSLKKWIELFYIIHK